MGKKLLARMLDDLHRNSKTSRITLSVGSEQQVAREMYEKLGFVQFGLAKKELKVKGKYYDQIWMELIFQDKL